MSHKPKEVNFLKFYFLQVLANVAGVTYHSVPWTHCAPQCSRLDASLLAAGGDFEIQEISEETLIISGISQCNRQMCMGVLRETLFCNTKPAQETH